MAVSVVVIIAAKEQWCGVGRFAKNPGTRVAVGPILEHPHLKNGLPVLFGGLRGILLDGICVRGHEEGVFQRGCVRCTGERVRKPRRIDFAELLRLRLGPDAKGAAAAI